jgi:hypothetical protein
MRDDKGMHNDRREGSKRQHRHRRRWPLTWGTRSEEYIMISGGIEGRLVAETAKPHFVTRLIFWSHRWMERASAYNTFYSIILFYTETTTVGFFLFLLGQQLYLSARQNWEESDTFEKIFPFFEL